MIDDRRDEQDKTRDDIIGFIVATDSFMSGWGRAPGRSLFALMVTKEDEPYLSRVWGNMAMRSDMKRPRMVGTKRNREGHVMPTCRVGPDDHLSIRDRADAKSWYR